MASGSGSSLHTSQVLSIQQHLLEDNKVPSTLKVYVAAISAHHATVDGSSLGSYNLFGNFLKGARRLKLVCFTLFPVWDLPLLHKFLCAPPFEPLGVADIK